MTAERAEKRSQFLASIRPKGNVHGQYAGFASRGMAFVIDLVLTTLIVLAVVLVIRGTLDLFGIRMSECTEFVPLTGFRSFVQNVCRIVRSAQAVFSLLLPLVYFFASWALGGQTVGNAIVGLKVVSTNGRKVTVGAAFLRLIGYAIAIIPLGLGFVWSLVDDRRQGWHDKLAGTYVIYWRKPYRFLSNLNASAGTVPIPTDRAIRPATLLEVSRVVPCDYASRLNKRTG